MRNVAAMWQAFTSIPSGIFSYRQNTLEQNDDYLITQCWIVVQLTVWYICLCLLQCLFSYSFFFFKENLFIYFWRAEHRSCLRFFSLYEIDCSCPFKWHVFCCDFKSMFFLSTQFVSFNLVLFSSPKIQFEVRREREGEGGSEGSGEGSGGCPLHWLSRLTITTSWAGPDQTPSRDPNTWAIACCLPPILEESWIRCRVSNARTIILIWDVGTTSGSLTRCAPMHGPSYRLFLYTY